ncbi:MAG: hypothetical protein MJ231_03095, partial [bacterium]|nr:hypothetical protein [bacterium]
MAPREAFAYKVVRKDRETGNVVWQGADTGVKVMRAGNELKYFLDGGSKLTEEENVEGVNYKDTWHNSQRVQNEFAYTLVTTNGTTPKGQGAGYLAIPDSLKPGAKYRGFDEENTGELYYDKDFQKEAENQIKNFSNRFGGSIASLESIIPYLKENGYKVLFSTPIANGDDVASHSYWNKNNMQISTTMGNMENLNSFFENLYA